MRKERHKNMSYVFYLWLLKVMTCIDKEENAFIVFGNKEKLAVHVDVLLCIRFTFYFYFFEIQTCKRFKFVQIY